VREFVLEGNVAGARKLLERPYSVEGKVVTGDARGRGLGFPTANIESDCELVPGAGVYVTVARSGSERLGAVTNIGTNPTFGGRRTTIETHLLDYSGDLYGRPLGIEFLARLRGERLFESPEALAARISSDVAEARRILAGCGAVPGAS
jgi:riboflavin kinase/FMN adenylyltransferase